MSLSRRQFLKTTLVSTVLTTVGGVAGFAYAHDIEPGWVEVVPQNLTLPRLPAAFNDFRLVQISDIHMGTGMTSERLGQIVELVNAQQPDVIAITGDFVTHGALKNLAPALIEPLSQLQSNERVVAVLGNHDHWTDPEGVREILRQSNIVDISNGLVSLERNGTLLHIAGVDDYWERKNRLEDVLENMPAEGCAVLLAHEPDFADISAETGRFDLQISGHSHGGQIILPFIGPPRIPTYARKYPLGRYQVGDMIQYTNRGLGTILPAIRFNCRPEITVLHPKSRSGMTPHSSKISSEASQCGRATRPMLTATRISTGFAISCIAHLLIRK